MLVIAVSTDPQWPIWVTSSVAASEGKRTEEGTITSTPELASKLATVADPPEAEASTPETTEHSSDIRTNCKISF
jgi:hypothetical protein